MSFENGWQVMVGAHDAPEVRGAQRLQAQIYIELDFLSDGYTLSEDGILSDQWSPASTHYAALIGSEPVGHLRLIDRRAGQLPVETMVEDLVLPEGCVEVSSLAVAPEYADGHPAMLMYRKAFHYSTDEGFTHWACVIERPLLDTLVQFFNFPFVEVGPEIDYKSWVLVPAMVDLAAVWERVENGSVDKFFGR